MSSPADSRRRSRSETEDDDDANVAIPLDSSKRDSTAASQSLNTPHQAFQQRRSNMYDDDNSEEDSSASEAGGEKSEFTPGAIVRVKLTNFVTYEKAEFFPGPNLNMVIGPNGTGKSSLVCAICLGLGWGPSHLGRAGSFGEFVKHNTNDAYIEIELQGWIGKPNHVVRLRIIKEGNNREWWLDDRRSTLKAVQALTRGFNIQVDNLCQFLPQDKVSAFSALSPVELLQQTQRAAAPPEMLEQHESLKALRKEQKSLDDKMERDKEELNRQETRQEGLRSEVQQLEERNQIIQNVEMLKKTVPFVEYRVARSQHAIFKEKKKRALSKLRDLEAKLAPTMASITQKEDYAGRITAVVRDRKNAVDNAEKDAFKFGKSIETVDEKIQQHQSKIDSEKQEAPRAKAELNKLQRSINQLKARLNDDPVVFDGPEWNKRIRTKDLEIRNAKEERDALKTERDELHSHGVDLRDRMQHGERELAATDTREGQQLARLKRASKETADAWEWVRENQDKFEKEVFGPPLITCSVKDPRYTAAIESLVGRNEMLAITTQTLADFEKLNNQVLGARMNLAEVTIKRSDGAGLDEAPLLPPNELRRLGLDGWALDFLDGPTAVLSMLVSSNKINKTPIGLRDINDEQHRSINDTQLNSFVAGSSSYRTSRRREYGPDAVSTSTKKIQPARHWTDQPVDTSGNAEIQSRIDSMKAEFADMKTRSLAMKAKYEEYASRIESLDEELTQIKADKAVIQKRHSEQAALPAKIAREEDTLKGKTEAVLDRRNRIKALDVQKEIAHLEKAQQALEYKKLVSIIRTRHEELLEAEVRLIEAKSDVAGLHDRNRDIDLRLEDERQRSRDAEAESERVKAIAARALRVCQQLSAEPGVQEHMMHYNEAFPNKTVEALEHEIAAEESKLEYTNANNPNAIRDFERFSAEVERLQAKVNDAEARLEIIGGKITETRSMWEPALDSLIGEISDAFSHNFQQIRCAGDVSVHKDDDFDLWAIQIKVKFRENEELQILDQHRQSGGERSVSTIFYLMSLQKMARAPFRVVDEINQGMDPRNERMVHERMVEIACKENTSQYFLITPKLLTGLRYDKRMKVLCIASGEHMPSDHKNLDIRKIIHMRRAVMAAA